MKNIKKYKNKKKNIKGGAVVTAALSNDLLTKKDLIRNLFDNLLGIEQFKDTILKGSPLTIEDTKNLLNAIIASFKDKGILSRVQNFNLVVSTSSDGQSAKDNINKLFTFIIDSFRLYITAINLLQINDYYRNICKENQNQISVVYENINDVNIIKDVQKCLKDNIDGIYRDPKNFSKYNNTPFRSIFFLMSTQTPTRKTINQKDAKELFANYTNNFIYLINYILNIIKFLKNTFIIEDIKIPEDLNISSTNNIVSKYVTGNFIHYFNNIQNILYSTLKKILDNNQNT